MRASRLIVGILGLALSALPSHQLLAQQPRERDPAPFERPKPIATIASTSTRETLTQLQGVLTARGYTISFVDWDRAELTAIKQDAPSSVNSDRVLLWLERDPAKPDERAYIHFLYGRFEPFFGSTEGPVRVRLAWAEELARMSALRDGIVAFALAQP
jgi:hypothetical protein